MVTAREDGLHSASLWPFPLLRSFSSGLEPGVPVQLQVARGFRNRQSTKDRQQPGLLTTARALSPHLLEVGELSSS